MELMEDTFAPAFPPLESMSPKEPMLPQQPMEIDCTDPPPASPPLQRIQQLKLAYSANMVSRMLLCQSPDLHPDAQLALSQDRDSLVRITLSRYPHLVTKAQRNLAKDEDTLVQAELAKNQNLNRSTQVLLAHRAHLNLNTGRNLARNPSLEPEAAYILYHQTADNQKQLQNLIKRNHAPLLDILASMHQRIALSKSLPDLMDLDSSIG